MVCMRQEPTQVSRGANSSRATFPVDRQHCENAIELLTMSHSLFKILQREEYGEIGWSKESGPSGGRLLAWLAVFTCGGSPRSPALQQNGE